MSLSRLHRSPHNRRECCPLRYATAAIQTLRKWRSRAVNPAALSPHGWALWPIEPNSGMAATPDCKSLMPKGIGRAGPVRAAQATPTPHPKQVANRPTGVAGSPSKNGKRFSFSAAQERTGAPRGAEGAR